MANRLLSDTLSVPLNGTTTAEIDINAGTGNLTIGPLTSGEPLLASGTLQYCEKQEPPIRTVNASDGQATLTLAGQRTGRAGFHWPWQACAGGAYEWQIHLNPEVPSDITAHSDGGNVRLDLAGMLITRLAADTGGGNMDVVLSDKVPDLSATIRSGAGNVSVLVPGGMAARVRATSGLGKVIVDSRFSKTDKDTYQSADYDGATSKVEITVSSGAGNVSIITE